MSGALHAVHKHRTFPSLDSASFVKKAFCSTVRLSIEASLYSAAASASTSLVEDDDDDDDGDDGDDGDEDDGHVQLQVQYTLSGGLERHIDFKFSWPPVLVNTNWTDYNASQKTKPGSIRLACYLQKEILRKQRKQLLRDSLNPVTHQCLVCRFVDLRRRARKSSTRLYGQHVTHEQRYSCHSAS